MRVAKMLAGVLLVFVIETLDGFAATKAIRFGKLVDGTGKVLTNVIVIVDGDRIKSVGTAESAIPAGSEVIDLSRYTAIPGLIDVHTHMAGSAGCPSCTPPARSVVELMNLAQERAKLMLDVGITTVRDLG